MSNICWEDSDTSREKERVMRKRKFVFNYSMLLQIFLILSLCLNTYFIIKFYNQNGEAQVLSWQQLREIWEPGTYGPSDMEVVKGPLRISAPGVTLQNTRVTEDLILTAAIGDGSVDLVNVIVENSALVQGGGEETVLFEDADINHLVINRVDGRVRVVLKGDTIVRKITILEGASLCTAGLSGKGRVGELSVETPAEVELEGDFATLCVKTSEAKVTILKGEVESLRTGKDAEGALIDLKDGVVIESLEVEAPLELSGEGTIKVITVLSPGLCKISGNVEKISAGEAGVILEFAAGNFDTVVVDPTEGTVMIQLAEAVAVKYMEFNGAAEVTGGGSIEQVRINVSGVVIEQKPGKVELAEGITAVVAGEDLDDEDSDKETTGKGTAQQKPAPAAPESPPPAPPPESPDPDEYWPPPEPDNGDENSQGDGSGDSGDNEPPPTNGDDDEGGEQDEGE